MATNIMEIGLFLAAATTLFVGLYISQKRREHARSVAQQLSLAGFRPAHSSRHFVLVLASDIHRGVIPALQYARSLSTDARGVHVATQESDQERLKRRWMRWSRGVPLVILPTEKNALVRPILDYVRHLQAHEDGAIVTVIVPELVTEGWLASRWHGRSRKELQRALRHLPGVIVTRIPYQVAAYVEKPRAENTAKMPFPNVNANSNANANPNFAAKTATSA